MFQWLLKVMAHCCQNILWFYNFLLQMCGLVDYLIRTFHCQKPLFLFFNYNMVTISSMALNNGVSNVNQWRCLSDGVPKESNLPKSAAEEPPMIGSGMETNTAPNFGRTPRKSTQEEQNYRSRVHHPLRHHLWENAISRGTHLSRVLGGTMITGTKRVVNSIFKSILPSNTV